MVWSKTRLLVILLQLYHKFTTTNTRTNKQNSAAKETNAKQHNMTIRLICIFCAFYFFPNNILFCNTLGTTRTVSEMRGLVRWSCVPTLGVELQSKLANVSLTTSVVTSRMPCKYLVYISSLTTTRLRGISKTDANRRASNEVAVNSHYKQTQAASLNYNLQYLCNH